jgi:DnaJ-class molecular chaperone
LAQLLGVDRGADVRDIKRSFRKLALELHPDKLGPNATEEQVQRFLAINHAYEVLSDEDKRRRYDEVGEDTMPAGGAGEGGSSQRFQEDLFEMFVAFKGGAFRFRRKVDPAKKAPPVVVPVTVTLEELMMPVQRNVTVTRTILCPHCKGSGAAGAEHIHRCAHCHGTGHYMFLHGNRTNYCHVVHARCPVCEGVGVTIGDKCPVCNGTQTSSEQVTLEYEIPAGAKMGQHVVIEGEGHSVPRKIRGDVVVQVLRAPHPRFQVSVSLSRALRTTVC